MRWLTGLRRDRRGGAAIEFAILAPVLFGILFGIVEVGRMFYVRHALEYATEQAARYYMLNPTTDSGSVTTYLQGQMAGGIVYGGRIPRPAGRERTSAWASVEYPPQAVSLNSSRPISIRRISLVPAPIS